MRLKEHDTKDGKRVWMSESEVKMLLENSDNIEQRLAMLLMVRSGLRRQEMLSVTPPDLVETSTGFHVRVRAETTKEDSYREPPVSEEIYRLAESRAEMQDPGDPIIDRDPKTIYRWVKRAADRCRAETGDNGWKYVTPHDLRRTWGTQLLERGVLPAVVMSWGGWEDWTTFRNHYLGEFSPEAIRRERQKVEFLADRIAAQGEQSTDQYSVFETRGSAREKGGTNGRF